MKEVCDKARGISVDDPISYPAVNRTSGEKPPPEGKTTLDDIEELEPPAIHSIQTFISMLESGLRK